MSKVPGKHSTGHAVLDHEVSTDLSRTDQAAKRLLAMSKIVYDKYRYIRWGMVLFGVAVLLCAVAAFGP